MKQTILYLTLMFCFTFAEAQSLDTKSTQELESLKEQAISSQDFGLAAKIKKELQSRKSIEDLIQDKQAQLNAAVKAGKYGKAEDLKNEITRLKSIKKQVLELKAQMQSAVELEDYVEAQRLNDEINRLKNNSNEATQSESDYDGMNSSNVESGVSKIVFQPIDTKNAFFLDVFIDGKFVHILNSKNGLTVLTKPGEHTIRLNWMTTEKFYLEKSINVKANHTYIVSLPEKVRARTLSSITAVVDENAGINSGENSEYHEVNLKEKKEGKWNPFFYPFNYQSGTMDLRHLFAGLPDEATGKFKINATFNFDLSLSKSSGFYLGLLYSSYLTTFTIDETTYSSGSSSIGPSFSYYFINDKTVVPFSGIEIPFTFSNPTGDKIEMGTGVNFRVGSHFFFSSSTGVSTQFRVGVTGGWSFQLGVSSRLISKKRAKYRGTYWYGK